MRDGVQQVVVLSGKGGTGKTSLTAAYASLAGTSIIADCDVDAANLHLILDSRELEQHEFISGHVATIRSDDCAACGLCATLCRFEAIAVKSGIYSVDSIRCEGCGLCVDACPVGAIDFPPSLCGTWMVSQTPFGPLVHARLQAAAENSGKLVTLVRKHAHALAVAEGLPLVIVDGPPGIGCPAIASMTGADRIVLVTEPSMSAICDVKRVADLVSSFSIPISVVVNKCDIDEGLTDELIQWCEQSGYSFAGSVSFDESIVQAHIAGCNPIGFVSERTERQIRSIWENICKTM